ncbi:unnamed protein product [Mytilus coruscus]|uniref:G-protein coupled receptors family 1 profile domain-containing protein n=1 Tax=Mytilus coruscus TaxID=42192 RepID=A0A6J8BTU7_MYTCO|nr:unnamed protein product [Mytilus coruscus]
MASNITNESRTDLQVCSDDISWNFIIVFGSLAACSLIFQICFAVITCREKAITVSLQQALFLAFKFIFFISYSLGFLIQQTGQCGWITISDGSCKFLTWTKNFSYTTCNCLLLFPWNRQYQNIIRHKILSFRLYVVCAIIIFGIVAIPYLVFVEKRTTVEQERNIRFSLCELSNGHDTVIEIIELVCGTAILSILLFIRIIADIIHLAPKSKQDVDTSQKRRYSQPPSQEMISGAKDKLNSRRLLQLNAAISMSYLVFVVPPRYADFILFMFGNRQSFLNLETENISSMQTYSWKILLSFVIILPLLHGFSLLPAYIITKLYAIKLFRRRASQPLKRKMPIRQHTDTNFCRSIDEVSEEDQENENSEVDNGSVRRA